MSDDDFAAALARFGAYSPRHVDWHPGETHAQLDGEFTAAELRMIADLMDATPKP